MTYSLQGYNALICGSTQGIGRACAAEMALQGAAVTLMARHEEALNLVRDELATDHGQTHGCIVADFCDHQQVQDRVHEFLSAGGPIHILLNNTGGPPAGRLAEADPEDLVEAFRKHIVCNEVLMQAVAPGMRDAGYGRIINIISTSVVIPIRGLGISNVTRGAVGNWGRTLAHELGPFGITVNNILPGYTDTARVASLFQGRAKREGSTPEEVKAAVVATVPLGRLAEPAEIGRVAAFLASPAASFVSGVNLPVDGGRLAGQ
jgi:3-oxoacyl-[acyl-carrier protein] reductase